MKNMKNNVELKYFFINAVKIFTVFGLMGLSFLLFPSCSQSEKNSDISAQPNSDQILSSTPANTRYTPKDPNSRHIYLKVVLQNFGDGEILKSVHKTLLNTSKNHNYEMSTNSPSDATSLTINIWSELPGYISLIQTLQNTLQAYSLRFDHVEEKLLIITPK